MIELFREKLKETKNLRNYTKEIMSLSFQVDYNKVNTMIADRQKYLEKIKQIDEKIKKLQLDTEGWEEAEINNIKQKIINIIKEIEEMDKIIRKRISNYLLDLKVKLNHPTNTKQLNIKA